MPRQESYRDVHVDRPLTNFSIAHMQSTEDFVSTRFFGSIPVQNASDEFDYYPSGYFNKIHDSRRAEESKANSITYAVTQKNYSVKEYALRHFISDKKRANVDAQRRLDQEATTLVSNALLLEKEQDFVNKFMKTGQWGTDWSGVAANPTANQFLKWSDANSNPVGDVKKLRREMLLKGKRRPNKAIMTLDVFDALCEHPDFMERIKYTGTTNNPAQVTLASMAQLFELDEILIMQTILNVALDGIEDADGFPPTTDQFMTENKFLLAYVLPGGGIMSPTAATTFEWTKYLSSGVSMRRYRESPAIRGEHIEGEMLYDQRIVAPDLGGLLVDVI